jgi:hypothetical protein
MDDFNLDNWLEEQLAPDIAEIHQAIDQFQIAMNALASVPDELREQGLVDSSPASVGLVVQTILRSALSLSGLANVQAKHARHISSMYRLLRSRLHDAEARIAELERRLDTKNGEPPPA